MERPEPDLRLELVSDRPPAGPLSVRWLVPASLVAHAALLFGLVLGPLLRADGLPEAASVTHAFFAAPALVAPPPPPSPPAATSAAKTARPARVPPRPAPAPAFVTLPDVPAEPASAESLSDVRAAQQGDPDSGDPGGIEGGVAGGVIGGVIGGLPGPVAPPAGPVRVGGEIKEPAKLRHVPPVYPDIAMRANVQGAVVLECTVSPQGRVAAVTVLRGIPLLNDAAVAAVKQWVYTPTLRDGVPVPLIMTVTVRFGISERARG
jgi:periplasmic protein TonB